MLDIIVHENKSPLLDKHKKKYAQQVLGRFWYYANAVVMTILYALSAITSEQVNPMERTLTRVQQLLHYIHTNLTSVICFHSSDLILNVYSNASYMSARKGQSCTGGYFFLRSMSQNGEPTRSNNNIAITL